MKTPLINKEQINIIKVEELDIPKTLPVIPDTTSTILLTKLFLTLVITIFLFGVDVASLSVGVPNYNTILYPLNHEIQKRNTPYFHKTYHNLSNRRTIHP